MSLYLTSVHLFFMNGNMKSNEWIQTFLTLFFPLKWSSWSLAAELAAEKEAVFYTTLKPNFIYVAIFLIIQIWQGG